MPLTVNSLTKTFGAKTAVDRLSFDMNAPGVFGLIGTNGAGKTTTIRMILGIMPPDSGTALWDGKKVTRATVRFGYMPEERGIYPKIKVGEQLVYFARLRGLNRADADAACAKWLRRMGVAEYRDTLAEKLSKGNQQKVQLISTLIHDPKLIFLDEPFSGLDPINTEVFKSVIAEEVNGGAYIVMSSHQMATVEEYCENLVILDRGETVLSGNLRGIKSGYGHTALAVRVAGDRRAESRELAEKCGLTPVNNTPDADEYKISGDEMARAYLTKLVEEGFPVERFEVREPTLNEIFIEKVEAFDARRDA